MKKQIALLPIILCPFLFLACAKKDDHAAAAQDHGAETHTPETQAGESDHAKKQAGPNGGRIVTTTQPHLEFFVTDNRHAQITFLDAEGRAAPLTDQKITLIGGDRANPTTLSFEKKGSTLISNAELPSENNVPIILQIQSSDTGKPILEKFNLNMNKCPECDYSEYACICGHDEDEH